MLLKDTFHAIDELDLRPIKMKLMHAESGEGWEQGRADAVEIEYRRFLFLMKKYPDAQTSPTVDVDLFWHYHILDTRKYAADCQAVFGHFLHHYPYVGLDGATDASDQVRSGERMQELYAATFGSATMDVLAGAWCTVTAKPKAAWCTVTDKPKAASKAAWCTVTDKPKAASKAAWCTATAKQDAAWCTVTSPANAAWCTVTSPAKAAWCTVTVEPKAVAAKAAWCTVTVDNTEPADASDELLMA